MRIQPVERFEITTPPRVVIGEGAVERLGELVSSLGRRVLLVTGSHPERVQDHINALLRQGFSVETLSIAHEPTLEDIEQGLFFARETARDLVVSMGGGSVLDAGKAIAGLVAHAGEVLDTLEVVGSGQTLHRAGIPFVAVPTTAGTGAEVTQNAVIEVTARRLKVSLRSPWLLARLVIVDPRLSLGLPLAVTRASGFDALTQLVEAFVSRRGNAYTDGLARDGLVRAARHLPRVCTEPNNLVSRGEMAYASLLSGLCLANAKLGAVHGLAGPLGGMFRAPHGALCAALLAPIMRANLEALRAEPEPGRGLDRLTEFASLVLDDRTASAEDGVVWLEALTRQLEVESLSALGVGSDSFGAIVERSLGSSSMQGNPVVLEPARLAGALREAL